MKKLIVIVFLMMESFFMHADIYYIALYPPKEILDEIVNLGDSIKKAFLSYPITLLSRNKIHLTMIHLGNLSFSQASCINEKLEIIASQQVPLDITADLGTKEVALLGNNNSIVLRFNSSKLMELRNAIDTAFSFCNPSLNSLSLIPHISFGKLNNFSNEIKDQFIKKTLTAATFSSIQWIVSEIVLVNINNNHQKTTYKFGGKSSAVSYDPLYDALRALKKALKKLKEMLTA